MQPGYLIILRRKVTVDATVVELEFAEIDIGVSAEMRSVRKILTSI